MNAAASCTERNPIQQKPFLQSRRISTPLKSKHSDFKAQGFCRRMAREEGDDTNQKDFVVDRCEPLVDLDSSDSTELWLIQWPQVQDLDFDGQEVSLKLNQDGSLGSFTGTSGKEYEVVSFKSLAADATVFVSCPSGSKAVGKISRRVSFVHYPEPNEVYDPNKAKEDRSIAFFERSLRTASSRYGPSMSRSTLMTRTKLSGGSSNQKGGVSQVNTPTKSSRKRKTFGSSDTKSSKVKQEH